MHGIKQVYLVDNQQQWIQVMPSVHWLAKKQRISASLPYEGGILSFQPKHPKLHL